MIVKQVQFKGVDSQGNVLCQPLLFGKDGGLEKTASMLEMRSKLHPRVQDFVRKIIPTPAGIYILVNALGAGEYWGSNVNGDFFPEKSLIHAPSNWEQLPFEEMKRVGQSWDYGFPTFMNAHPYKHHMNKDPSRAFGRVELAVWNPKMHRVELVLYLDRALCMQFDAMDVIERIERGEFPDVSMGCKVPFDVCMICGKQSKTPNDYCEHAAMMMNKILPDGRKVCVRNDFPRFFDISIVFIGADKTAKVMAKLAQVGRQICLGDFCTVPRPSHEVGTAFSPFMGLQDLSQDLALEKVAAYHGSPTGGIKELEPRVDPRTGKKALFASPLLEHAAVHSILPDRANTRIAFNTKDGKFTGGVALSPVPFLDEGYLYDLGDTKGRPLGKKHEGRDSTTVTFGRKVKPVANHKITRKDVENLGWFLGDSNAYDLYVAPSEKTAAMKLHPRARNALAGGAIGAGAGIAGGAAAHTDRDEKRKDLVKDFVAGSLAGALVKHASVLSDDAWNAMSAEEQLRHRQELADKWNKADAFFLAKMANDPIKKKIEVQGVPIWIEWKKGETRIYKDKKGVVKYERHMKADYGYIPDTLDADGEELDVYVGPDRTSPRAFVIKQLRKDGSFDEHKVMIGYQTKDDAKASYDHHMGGAKERFGGMRQVPVSALRALFGENGGKEKKASDCSCSCKGEGLCGDSIDKVAAAIFPVREKAASHAKLSELIKSIPAGPFSRETLPRLESSERDIPNDVLDLMGGLPGGAGLSTPAMAGMVLKPREFQRIVLVHLGRKPLADEMDSKGMTFQRSNDVDESFQPGSDVEPRLMELLSALGLIQDRSAAGPALARRSLAAQSAAPSADQPFRPLGQSDTPLMKKLATAYNGYRQWLLKKTAHISNFMTTDPQLRADLFGSSMAQVFAGGIDKVATSVLSPDSLAYLVGAYQNRDVAMGREVVASLAHTGAMAVPV